MSPEEKDQKIERLEQENQELRQKIAELERRLGLDSQTSSKPPSSDGLKKSDKIRTKSLREKGKRPSGGQFGHVGQTLEQVLKPDHIVKAASVKHLDETGLRIGGKTNWLHVVSTQTETWYRVAAKRKDIEVLAEIKGVVVHDHWKPYYQLEDVNHALCNAHHLRELKALEEIDQESEAQSMKKVLLLACNYKHRYPQGIPENIIARINQLYEQILNRL